MVYGLAKMAGLPAYSSDDHAESADTSDHRGWDAGSLPGDLNDHLCSLSSLCSLCFARLLAIFQGPRMRQLA
jgi:hypothetical protein